MNRIINIVCESASLFVNSGWLAQTVVGVIVLAAIVSEASPDLLATALVLLLGFIGRATVLRLIVADKACRQKSCNNSSAIRRS